MNVKTGLVNSMFIIPPKEAILSEPNITQSWRFLCNNFTFFACNILRGYFHCFHVACWLGGKNSVHKWNFKKICKQQCECVSDKWRFTASQCLLLTAWKYNHRPSVIWVLMKIHLNSHIIHFPTHRPWRMMMLKLDWLMGKKKKNPKKRRNWENFNIHWIMISRITRSEGENVL